MLSNSLCSATLCVNFAASPVLVTVTTLIAVTLNSCTASAEVAEVELKYTAGRGGSGLVLQTLLSVVFIGDQSGIGRKNSLLSCIMIYSHLIQCCVFSLYAKDLVSMNQKV